MASVPHGGIVSLGTQLECEGANSECIAETYTRIFPLAQPKTDQCKYEIVAGKGYSLLDLPIQNLLGGTKLIHFVDVIEKAELQLDVQAITEHMERGSYKDLPGLLAPKEHIPGLPYTMRLCVRSDPDTPECYTVMKHYVFINKTDVRIAQRIAQGVPHTICYGVNQKIGKKVFTDMFHWFGGHQWKSLFAVIPQPLADGEEDKSEKIRAATKFIKENAPRGNFDLEQTEWLEVEMANPKSPLQALGRGTIHHCLQQLSTRDSLATKQTVWPLFLSDLNSSYMKVFSWLIREARRHSVLMLGEPQWAKTPSALTILFAIARHEASKPESNVVAGVRTAADLDFFRGGAGCVEVPCMFDDGDLNDSHPKVLKAFFDITQAEAMTRERWGSTKFVQNQARFAADNTYDEAAGPSNEDWSWVSTVAWEEALEKKDTWFLDMMRPAFPPGISMPNIRAIVKRCTVLINTKSHLYVRYAGVQSDV